MPSRSFRRSGRYSRFPLRWITTAPYARQYLAKNHFVAFPADAAGLRKYQIAEIERELRIIDAARIPKQ
ncbi:MAG TPA: hypothetical protein PK359_13395 [Burkholderiaceae bacterium]|nr:hypothetical protein [Burkholderiaceae bacterium]